MLVSRFYEQNKNAGLEILTNCPMVEVADKTQAFFNAKQYSFLCFYQEWIIRIKFSIFSV